jgi:hypothetical protein
MHFNKSDPFMRIGYRNKEKISYDSPAGTRPKGSDIHKIVSGCVIYLIYGKHVVKLAEVIPCRKRLFSKRIACIRDCRMENNQLRRYDQWSVTYHMMNVVLKQGSQGAGIPVK